MRTRGDDSPRSWPALTRSVGAAGLALTLGSIIAMTPAMAQEPTPSESPSAGSGQPDPTPSGPPAPQPQPTPTEAAAGASASPASTPSARPTPAPAPSSRPGQSAAAAPASKPGGSPTPSSTALPAGLSVPVGFGFAGQVALAAVPNDTGAIARARQELAALDARAVVVQADLRTAEAGLRTQRVDVDRLRVAAIAQAVVVATRQAELDRYLGQLYRSGGVTLGDLGWYDDMLTEPDTGGVLHTAATRRVADAGRGDALGALRAARRDLARITGSRIAAAEKQERLTRSLARSAAALEKSLAQQRELVRAIEADAGYAIFAEVPPLPAPELAPRAVVRGEPGEVSTALPPLRERLPAELLVTGTLTAPTLRRLADSAGGSSVLRLGPARVGAVQLDVVGIDAATFRAFAPAGAAEMEPLWRAVADGELVLSHRVAALHRFPLGGSVTLTGPVGPNGEAAASVTVRLAGLATVGITGTEVMVSQSVATTLGLRQTGVVLAARDGNATALRDRARRLAGPAATIANAVAPNRAPMAFLGGGAAGRALGSFRYSYLPDGSIEPDAAWVARHIVTTTVPILGRVRCHRVLLPQLRGALQELVASGLAGSIRPGEYGGCYVPRFIASDPTQGISLHTWGIAFDVNVPRNGRGTVGELDRRVVEIFKRWGFRWGGDWTYTDPMHFELGGIAR